jgi:hypothetical protein
MFELQTTARAQDQYAPVIRRALREEQVGPPVLTLPAMPNWTRTNFTALRDARPAGADPVALRAVFGR